MSNTNKINKLNEAMAIAWLEDLVTSENEAVALQITQPAIAGMTADKKNKMIEQLYNRVSTLSFGELLTKSMAERRVSASDISNAVELQELFIRNLQEDRIAVNNIPVIILKKLLNNLTISFAEAKGAILKTFEIIRSNVATSEENFSVRPAFRRGKMGSDSDSYKRLPNKDLFENEESLNKYLERLEKLMQ